MSGHAFSHQHIITIDQVVETVRQKSPLTLSKEALEKIQTCRDYLLRKITEEGGTYYGINTGFGSLCDVQISKNELGQLQENLVKSHACGVGGLVPNEIARLMLFLKIQSVVYGHSGVTQATAQQLVDYYNHDLIPVIYEMGSLGASGDLAPLAHLSLPLIGFGQVTYNGCIEDTKDAMNKEELAPTQLKAKEGLALLNGTQFMSAYGTWCIYEAERLLDQADFIAALSIDAFHAKSEPFHTLIHQIRNSKGQIQTAKNILAYLENSEISHQDKSQIQDPYSFRCIPQVHGASREAVQHSREVIESEINAVTDNPNIFPEADEILSGGNFHGQRLAMTLDYLTLAMSEIGSISERRTYKMLSGERELPAFLIADPGLNSGLMIPQYTAASLCSQNRQLCTPASADSITSSNEQEDHVSMGANAAIKAYQVVNNVKTILAIELMTAAQALEFRRPAKSSSKIEAMMSYFRQHVAFLNQDRVLHEDIDKAKKFLEHHLVTTNTNNG